jgi:hypothetical protein
MSDEVVSVSASNGSHRRHRRGAAIKAIAAAIGRGFTRFQHARGAHVTRPPRRVEIAALRVSRRANLGVQTP